MAFPVPEHLPRKQLPTDVSSKILSKISDVTSKSLSAELAAEWVSELDVNIQQTKNHIYGRIHQELSDFERQFDSSRSVQTRFHDLALNVNELADALDTPGTGILPPLLEALKAHKELTQRASDAQVTYGALSYLRDCRTHFENLIAMVDNGQLAGGVRLTKELTVLLESAPEALARADVMTDMMKHLRALKDRTEEQLNEAYSRSIRISSTELRISPSVRVRQSQTVIALQDILGSLSELSLEFLLASLRRDIIAHFIDFPLRQASISNVSRTSDADGTLIICFSIFPLPPSPRFKDSTPGYLKTFFGFLRENLVSAFPPPVRSSFPRSLYRPTASALLNNVLIPSLPSSLADLPPFLELAQDAVRFEKEYLREDSGSGSLQGEGDVQAWVRGVSSHYGRKRRTDILAGARNLVLTGTESQTIRVEVSEPQENPVIAPTVEVIPVQGDISGEPENGWDFDEEASTDNAEVSTNGGTAEEGAMASPGQVQGETGGWDFDDADTGASDQAKGEDDVQDDSDAWGWGDEEETSTPATSENGNVTESDHAMNGHQGGVPKRQESSEDSAWDDAWGEPEPVPPSPPVQVVSPAKAPKVAKGLEKLTTKGKGKGPASPAPSSNPPSSTFSAPSTFPSITSSNSQPFTSSKPQAASPSSQRSGQSPSNSQATHLKPPALSLPQTHKEPEMYLISSRVQDLVQLISGILSEGRSIAGSSILSDFPLSSPDSNSNTSTLVLQAAPAALDLYRAVYPVVFAAEFSRPARALRFSNECTYVHEEVTKLNHLLASSATSIHEQMNEALERLHALGTWWSDEGIERQCKRILHILSRAEGFVEMSDQERFDECEAVMSEVLQDVRAATGEWKKILPRMKWLRAAGRVVETALARVLDDVLAIPDIPKADSHRLCELCRILNALEGLFVDTASPEAPSVVLDYVPSWLKYSYLSELLVASIADISYLFDEGTLIDFSVDELVRLVRALFADTPLRSNTIAKLQRGHPVSLG